MRLTKLKEIRQERGVRVEDLANAAGLTVQQIYMLERQERGASGPSAIVLALLLGVKVDDLTDDAGPGAEVGHFKPLVGPGVGA